MSSLQSGRVLGDHRVRFLCFLGIASDDRFCGYILDNGELKGERFYRFHGFIKEPNTDKLYLALHSACQARYKRVLQAQAIRHAASQQVCLHTQDSRSRTLAANLVLCREGEAMEARASLSPPLCSRGWEA